MEIFCQKCQKSVGRVADEKLTPGQKASVKCPLCGDKIAFMRPASPETFDATIDENIAPPTQQPGSAIPGWQETVADGPKPNVSRETTGCDFTIGAILKEAWQKTSGVKGPLWAAGIMAFLVMFLAYFVLAFVVRMFGLETGGIALGAALQITLTVAMYPFLAGAMMIGIRRSVELPVNWKMAFAYYSFLLPVVVASILTTLLTFIGFLLLLIPGIYLSLCYMLTVPLIVDKGMGPWQAMETSRKAVHKCWFKVLGLYLVMALIYLVSMIPLCLGVIWTLPMFVMVSAILYREIFGVSEKA